MRRPVRLAMEYETEHYDRLADQLASGAAAPPAGIVIPGYQLLRELNRGGQAVVFLATQESTGRRVAVKLLAEGPLARAGERARLDREVTILAALHHPHIVSIIDRGATRDGWLYLVMEYIDGKPLDEWLADTRKRAPSPRAALEAALRVFLKVCDAVNVAHLRGIVHRDLKPSNILVDDGAEPHVLDFGLARPGIDVGSKEAPSPAVTATGQFVGSLPWASPEQAEGISSRIDIRSDVYSLGVILYQILTGGRFPYAVTGTMPEILQNILAARVTPPSEVLSAAEAQSVRRRFRFRRGGSAGVAPSLEAVALKALAKRREDRYQTAGELARDVENFLSGKPARAADSTARRWSRLLILEALGCALALGAFWLYRQWRPREDGARPVPTAAAATVPAPAPATFPATKPSPMPAAPRPSTQPSPLTFRVLELDRSARYALAAADLDGDGTPDLACNSGSDVEVWPGGGIDGRRPTPHAALGEGQMRVIVVADVNRDGKNDVIAGNWATTPGRIAVLVNRGGGTFAAPVTYPTEGPLDQGESIAAADFDGDGRTDLLAAMNAPPFALRLYPGKGDGTFGDAVTFAVNACSLCMTLGDVDGDGRTDLVTLGENSSSDPQVTPRENVLLVSNRGTAERVPLGGVRLSRAAVADFNGDGRADAVAAAPHSLGFTKHTLEIWLGNTTRPPLHSPYLGPRRQAAASVASGCYAGNFDGDGKPDLLMVHAEAPTVAWEILRGRGDGTFGVPEPVRGVPVAANGSASAVADFNGDGLDDIAITYDNFLGIMLNKTRVR